MFMRDVRDTCAEITRVISKVDVVVYVFSLNICYLRTWFTA
jgi:hypothetical protein